MRVEGRAANCFIDARRLNYLILAAVIGFAGCCVLVMWGRYARRQIIERDIRQFGGYAYCAFHGPQWLHYLLGDNLLSNFGEPYFAKFESPMTDSELRQLVETGLLSTLLALDLSDTGISDHGLTHLCPLNKLRELALKNDDVTDAGLEHLKRLKNLASLHLHGTKVTTDAVERFQRERPGCRVKM